MNTVPDDFLGYLTSRETDGRTISRAVRLKTTDLPAGDVTIRVRYSSLNYKDALSLTGNPGVTRTYPHVGGIDAAGVVLASDSPRFRPGDEVIVTGYEFGTNHWGGYAQIARVPADWPVPLPAGLSLHESMVLGTAGFTAAQSVAALAAHSVQPESGPVVVTGASGGVGSLAVALLAKAGYEVVAVSGKPIAAEMLIGLGASRVVPRTEVDDASHRPLLPGHWAGAVDTVGGRILATLIRSTKTSGCVTACGLVAGAELPLSVYPFILRGVALVGIDSAWRSHEERMAIWNRLADPDKIELPQSFVRDIQLAELEHWVPEILAGRVLGRIVVCLPEDSAG